MRKFFVTFFLVIVAYVLQTTALPSITIADIAPNLLLIISAYAGYINGRTVGLFTGFSIGLLLDCQFGSILGLYALIYMLIAYLCGFFHKIYFREDSTLPIIIIVVSDFLYGLLEYIFNFAFRNKLEFGFYLKRIILPEMIYTIIFSIILYRIMLYLYKHEINILKHKKEVDDFV